MTETHYLSQSWAVANRYQGGSTATGATWNIMSNPLFFGPEDGACKVKPPAAAVSGSSSYMLIEAANNGFDTPGGTGIMMEIAAISVQDTGLL